MFRLAAGEAGEQLLSPEMQRPEVEAGSKNAELLFECLPPRKGFAPTLVLASGVTTTFDEDDGLYAVAAFER